MRTKNLIIPFLFLLILGITGCQKEVISPEDDATLIEFRGHEVEADHDSGDYSSAARNGDGRPTDDIEYVNDDSDEEEEDEEEILSDE